MKPAPEKISLRQAAKLGITRLRLPQWVNPFDHAEITILEGDLGIWIRLWAPFNEECNGQDPVPLLTARMHLDNPDWLPYEGKLPDSPEYLAARATFAGCLKENNKS